MARWLAENGFNLLTAVCSIGGLWFAGFALHKDAEARKEETKARKVSNLLAITANYREVWKDYFLFPDLNRILESSANVENQPVTPREELFVGMVISQMSSVYYATKDDLLNQQEGARRDIAEFFSLPIPKAVWQRTRPLQNQDFAAFIDSLLK